MEKQDLDTLVRMGETISRAGLDADFDAFCRRYGSHTDPVFRYAMASEFIRTHELHIVQPDYHCVVQHGYCIVSVGRSASEALDTARQYLSTPDLVCHEDYAGPVDGYLYLLPCDEAVYTDVMSHVWNYDVIDGRVCYCKD